LYGIDCDFTVEIKGTKKIYFGEYNGVVPSGKATHIDKKRKRKYEGEFIKDDPHHYNGNGTLVYRVNGVVCEGSWDRSRLHGLGTITYPGDNASKKGKWHYGTPEFEASDESVIECVKSRKCTNTTKKLLPQKMFSWKGKDYCQVCFRDCQKGLFNFHIWNMDAKECECTICLNK
jgi:hypothetical protein